MKRLLVGFILIFVSVLSFAKGAPVDDFEKSIKVLKSTISDIYSVAEVVKILDAPKNRKVVFLRVSGFFQGNNSYTYLAVFEKSQKSINIQGETYQYFGDIHFRQIGCIQVGGHHFGSIDMPNVKITNDTISIPINYSGSDLLMLNGEVIKSAAPALNVKINSFGLSVSL